MQEGNDMAEAVRELMEEEDTQHGRYMTFHIGEATYGLEIRIVTEIIGIHPITPVPDMPDYVLGIINLRGKVIPVIDLRLRFRLKPLAYNDRTCIIVVDMLDVTVGFIVDSVSEVVNIEDSQIEAPPDVGGSLHNRYLSGIGVTEDGAKLILDCEKLLEAED
jgi:purine-binding chemotaxis protein CheW